MPVMDSKGNIFDERRTKKNTSKENQKNKEDRRKNDINKNKK